MPKQVLFIQGGGQGAHAIDADLAASLARLLGGEWRRPSRRNRSPGPCAELATMEDDACLFLNIETSVTTSRKRKVNLSGMHAAPMMQLHFANRRQLETRTLARATRGQKPSRRW